MNITIDTFVKLFDGADPDELEEAFPELGWTEEELGQIESFPEGDPDEWENDWPTDDDIMDDLVDEVMAARFHREQTVRNWEELA